METTLDKFTQDYIAAALTLMADRDYQYAYEDAKNGEQVERPDYQYENLAPETAKAMIADCAKFQAINRINLIKYEQQIHRSGGTDFWLTREGHGAGYWDRQLDNLGKRLTDSAHTFGEFELYLGDDGKIYAMGHES
jgi:hypothetical protein